MSIRAPDLPGLTSLNLPQGAGIDWQLDAAPQLSAKDKVGALLKDAEVFA